MEQSDTLTSETIIELAELARIGMSPDEAETCARECSEILSYVASVQNAANADTADAPELDAHHTVMRADEPTHAPGEYSETLLAAAPERDGRYISVKKVLGSNDE